MSTTDAAASNGTVPAAPTAGPRVAVVVSRFPKFTETFVVNEVLALQRLGLHVEVHPLLPVEPLPHQPAALPLVEAARFGSPWGVASLRALAVRATRQPATLARLVGLLIRRTWRKPTVLIKDLSLLPRVCAIADELERQDVHHVHAHFATHAGFAAFAIGRLTGIPYSIVAHGSDVHRHQLMLADKVAEAAFVATVSEYNRAVMRAVCPPDVAERIEVVRMGIDLSGDPATGAPHDERRDGEATTLLCVGTLHEVKGQRHLVNAVAVLRERGRDVHLQLVGEGTDRAELERLVRELELDDRVELTGALPHDEVLRRFAAATIVVAPSVASSDGRKEGIPTVLIEAMARGTSVVASDLAGIAELVEHEVTGLLAPPGDASAIAAAVERLLSDRALAATLASAASARVHADFDIDRTAARMADLMTRAAGAPSTAHTSAGGPA